MFQLVLGSQSPRRKEILSYFSLPFDQATPTFNEESLPFNGEPEEYVCVLSKGKADSLAPVYPKAALLTADSIVYRNGKVYGKPKDRDEAFQTLKELQGEWHSVFTGVTLRHEQREFHKAEETRVLFNPLTDEQIRLYHSRTTWSDKAGGYGAQMGGGLIVQKIDGCFYNVMGLPINAVKELFMHIGIDLWHYL